MNFKSVTILVLVIRLKLLFASEFEECGISDIDPRSLIAQGKSPTRREWPWIINIDHNQAGFIGGGTIVSLDAVITSAELVHPKGKVNPRPANEFVVYMDNKQPIYIQRVSKVIVHPDWNSSDYSSLDADIAILFIKLPVAFSETLRPICLPPEMKKINYNDESTLVSIVEYITGRLIPIEAELRIGNSYVTESFECVARSQYNLGPRSFCTELNSEKCAAKYGYGLAEKINNRWTLIGIVTFISWDYIENKPCSHAYTEVSKFSTWIQQHITLDYLNRASELMSCGKPLKAQSLISRGNALNIENWPWMVALFYGSTFICGGSIISEKAVLTAAHCFHDKDEMESRIGSGSFFIAGKSNLDSFKEKGFKILQVAEIKMHPDWDPILKSYEGDIALVTLSKAITFTEKIKPICLPSPSDSIVNVRGAVAGWGYTEKNRFGGQLKLARLSVISKRDCVNADNAYSYTLGSKSFCTEKSDSGPCQADSGGGFAVEFNNSWKIMGIVSFTAILFCDEPHIVAYTEVSKYLDWINLYLI